VTMLLWVWCKRCPMSWILGLECEWELDAQIGTKEHRDGSGSVANRVAFM